MSLATSDAWRAERGLGPQQWSNSAYQSACQYATQMATDKLGTQHSGHFPEIVAVRTSCSSAINAWLASAGHQLAFLNWPDIGIACVTDSRGTAWVVGHS